jgi:hypothetical protein
MPAWRRSRRLRRFLPQAPNDVLHQLNTPLSSASTLSLSLSLSLARARDRYRREADTTPKRTRPHRRAPQQLRAAKNRVGAVTRPVMIPGKVHPRHLRVDVRGKGAGQRKQRVHRIPERSSDLRSLITIATQSVSVKPQVDQKNASSASPLGCI